MKLQSTTRTNYCFAIGAALVLFAGAWLVIVQATAAKNARAAEAFLADIQNLTIGQPSADVRAFAERYRSHLTEAQNPCTPTNCEYRFQFQNSTTSLLRHIITTQFSASLGVWDGQLKEIRAGAGTTYGLVPKAVWVGVTESVNLPQELPADLAVLPHRDPYQGVDVIRIELRPHATAAQRRDAYNLNLDCLGAIRGCTDTKLIRTNTAAVGWPRL